MPTPIYLRKSGDENVRLHALVEVSQEAGSRLEFQSKDYLSVDSQSHYYITRRSAEGSLELWLVDLPEGWMQDD